MLSSIAPSSANVKSAGWSVFRFCNSARRTNGKGEENGAVEGRGGEDGGGEGGGEGGGGGGARRGRSDLQAPPRMIPGSCSSSTRDEQLPRSARLTRRVRRNAVGLDGSYPRTRSRRGAGGGGEGAARAARARRGRGEGAARAAGGRGRLATKFEPESESRCVRTGG